MYLIAVESKLYGSGWFRGFPVDESKKPYITENIGFAKQYSRKQVAEMRKQKITERADVISAKIMKMDLIELQNHMSKSGVTVSTANGVVKARITALACDVLASIDVFKRQFDIVTISDMIKDTDTRYVTVYITFRCRQDEER